MGLELHHDTTFLGPALPEPFVVHELEAELRKLGTLPGARGRDGDDLQESWRVYRRKLREMVSRAGPRSVLAHVIEPLVERLGYSSMGPAPEVETPEGQEAGGHVLTDGNGACLRVWTTSYDEDIDSPRKRGHAYRFGHLRVALLQLRRPLGLPSRGPGSRHPLPAAADAPPGEPCRPGQEGLTHANPTAQRAPIRIPAGPYAHPRAPGWRKDLGHAPARRRHPWRGRDERGRGERRADLALRFRRQEAGRSHLGHALGWG